MPSRSRTRSLPHSLHRLAEPLPDLREDLTTPQVEKLLVAAPLLELFFQLVIKPYLLDGVIPLAQDGLSPLVPVLRGFHERDGARELGQPDRGGLRQAQ